MNYKISSDNICQEHLEEKKQLHFEELLHEIDQLYTFIDIEKEPLAINEQK